MSSSQRLSGIPKIGVLLAGDANSVGWGYFKILYDYFADVAAKGQCTLQPLGWKIIPKGAHVPWDLEPLDVARTSPGPMPEDVAVHRFDGLISLGICSPQYLAEIAQIGAPLVVLDSSPVGVNCDSVMFDGLKGGFQIGQHLAATGHRDILFVSLLNRDTAARSAAEEYIEDDASTDRRYGVLNGIEGTAATLWPALPIRPDATTEKLAQQLYRYLKSTGRVPDALTGHDTTHVGKVRLVLEHLGIKTPDRVSVITFDSDPPLSEYSKALSHLQYSWREMAAAGWSLLSSRIRDSSLRNAPPCVERITGRFIDRGSVLDRRTGLKS